MSIFESSVPIGWRGYLSDGNFTAVSQTPMEFLDRALGGDACPGQHPTRPRPPVLSPRPLRVQSQFSRRGPRPLRPTTQPGRKLLPRPRPPNLADLWQAKPRVVENARKFRRRRFPSLLGNSPGRSIGWRLPARPCCLTGPFARETLGRLAVAFPWRGLGFSRLPAGVGARGAARDHRF